jgi:hypothetical protein
MLWCNALGLALTAPPRKNTFQMRVQLAVIHLERFAANDFRLMLVLCLGFVYSWLLESPLGRAGAVNRYREGVSL